MGNLVVAAFCIPFLWSCGQDSKPKSISIEPDMRVEEQAPPPQMEQRQMPAQESIKSRVDTQLSSWCDDEVVRLEEKKGKSELYDRYLNLKIKRIREKCLTK